MDSDPKVLPLIGNRKGTTTPNTAAHQDDKPTVTVNGSPSGQSTFMDLTVVLRPLGDATADLNANIGAQSIINDVLNGVTTP